jgi:hypothetical protein
MYLVTFRVEKAKLQEFLKAAAPHGTMHRCHPETEEFELSQRELDAIGQGIEDIVNRLRSVLLHLHERLDKANAQ